MFVEVDPLGGVVLRDSSYSEKDSEPQYWFNLKTLKVEVGPQSISKNRVGPFKSKSEASNALSVLGERSESWRQEEESESN